MKLRDMTSIIGAPDPWPCGAIIYIRERSLTVATFMRNLRLVRMGHSIRNTVKINRNIQSYSRVLSEIVWKWSLTFGISVTVTAMYASTG